MRVGSCTHLVSQHKPTSLSAKCHLAQALQLPVLHASWLEDSVAAGAMQPVIEHEWGKTAQSSKKAPEVRGESEVREASARCSVDKCWQFIDLTHEDPTELPATEQPAAAQESSSEDEGFTFGNRSRHKRRQIDSQDSEVTIDVCTADSWLQTLLHTLTAEP